MKTDELKELVSETLSCCAKETFDREGSDTVKVLLCGIDVRFREEHDILVEATNSHTGATNVQTSYLEALFNEAKILNVKMEEMYSHIVRLRDIEPDIATLSNVIGAIENKSATVSSFSSILKKGGEDTRLIFEDSANEIWRM